MSKKSFLLVSLQEDKAKKLAQVVSNESCRKILDYLSDHEATETDLSEKLGVPLSTVHYNLQHLQKASLVVVDEFHYSEKGKEVNHYKLANKYIIIAPKSTHGISEKLKSILPVGLIALGGAFLIGIWDQLTGFGGARVTRGFSAQEAFKPTVSGAVEKSAPVAADVGEKIFTDEVAREIIQAEVSDSVSAAAPEIVREVSSDVVSSGVEEVVTKGTEEGVQKALEAGTQQVITTVAEPSILQNVGLWFFIGALVAIGLYVIFSKRD
ncbi:MAG: winged helix-turn-helix domain-containing protein [Candidatus Woesearchaeota archaeon]|jgi:DNA-binding transcriptional ArsR family regulator|nr:winged helix-turn-helix domain-containing protein [Candidatus Woesearchaeota archaeon]MDP7180018.1 winged helix-turn-helix domain-containing protein [Candidatus Woesearchaeota archaeon]